MLQVAHGDQLARSIRGLQSSQGGRRPPVIACPASALEGEAEKFFEAGFDDSLVKPTTLSQLRNQLQQWLPLPEQPATTGGPGA